MNTLTLVCGQPASGKTTWGQQFADKTGALFIDIDRHYEPVVQAGLRLAGYSIDDRDSPAFKQAYRQAIYDAMFALAEDNIATHSVVLAAPFTQELDNPDWHNELAHRYQCNVYIVWLRCDEATLKKRMEARGDPRDKAKLRNWQTYQDYVSRQHAPACKHTCIEQK